MCVCVCVCVFETVAPIALAMLALVLGASVRSCSSLTEVWFTSTYFMNTLVNYFSLVMY